MNPADLSRNAAAGLAGRDTELQSLHSFLEAAAADGRALLISGDAGVGKTALLDAAATAAAAAGTRVVRAVATEFEAEVSRGGAGPAGADRRRHPPAHLRPRARGMSTLPTGC